MVGGAVPPALLAEIRALVDAPPSGEDGPYLERLERVLTDGYAHALALEAERERIERRIDEVAAMLAQDGLGDRARELAVLSRRRESAHGDLERLRALLASLRERVSALR